ncbi:CPBP family intramembrane glutamic endopeptidase [Paenibacillus arenilitoris]|uniref:CPBP family intramembrane metalloprotease n=1 Tax=Paenibacillus arenilitoris TaxID=2772299 RepID=A0A927H9L9_9BACL|nr:CPBP family intramembrane glutamic endopeptidase [Paenibacillus arenilitoris]MBD2872762.1 CPBP family intramembrane metalloprotease [Paenibacillus arenilitoris]
MLRSIRSGGLPYIIPRSEIPIKSAAEIIGKLLLTIVIVIVLLVIVLIAYFVFSGSSLMDLEAAVSDEWSIYAQMIVFTIAAFGMYALFERKRGWPLGFMQKSAALWTVRGMLAGILLMSASAALIWLLGGAEWHWIGFNRTVILSLLDGAVLYAAVAVYEEFFARGYVQGLIRYHYGSITAVVVSSILFALMHGFNPGSFESPLPMVNLWLAGVLLAVSREASGGLWLPIGLHLTWNYFQGYVYGFRVSGTDNVPSVIESTASGPVALSGGSFGVEGSFVTTIITIAGIAAVYAIYNGKKRES